MKANPLLSKIAPALLATTMASADASSLGGAVAWLNSSPLAIAKLHGKVVLIDFWTYTCVNWRRTLPYVRAWAHKYKADGLVVIGAHTPEFSFEKNLDNVRWATATMGVDYPVAVDSNYAIWNSFDNQYWPALYVIDAHGQIRAHYFGEGSYAQVERTIQTLLAETGKKVDRSLVTVHPAGLEVPANWDDVKSPETYVGRGRGNPRVYPVPVKLQLNEWALYGNWSIGDEAAALNTSGGRLAYHFHARDVNLIMGPQRAGDSVRFRVLIDGKPPGKAAGGDVDADGYGTVTRQTTYQLIRQPEPIEDRTFEIEFLDHGIEAYDFTFG